ncbi:hypothetical protein GF354_00405 [Candidatus Peregrinibacteria bacterium]|nr:hypothetical protein [Candidatus Peregrinibacteria bacterium]
MGNERTKNWLETGRSFNEGISLNSLRSNARVVALMAFISAMAACTESDMNSFAENEASETVSQSLVFKNCVFHSEGVIAHFEPIGRPLDVIVSADGKNMGKCQIDTDGTFNLGFDTSDVETVILKTEDGQMVYLQNKPTSFDLLDRDPVSE